MVFPMVVSPSPKGGYHGVAIVPLPVALAEGMPLAAVVRAEGRTAREVHERLLARLLPFYGLYAFLAVLASLGVP